MNKRIYLSKEDIKNINILLQDTESLRSTDGLIELRQENSGIGSSLELCFKVDPNKISTRGFPATLNIDLTDLSTW